MRASPWDFSDLRALYINCTLKRSPGASNTRGLAVPSIAILERNGVSVGVVRAIDHDVAKDNYKFESIVMGIVKSTPFQMRKTEVTTDHNE